MKLVYAALFKNQPKNPTEFVSNYVHYLNMHREALVVADVDIPFDRQTVIEEVSKGSEDGERNLVREFAKQIVESCINLATLRKSYIDVMSIINSLLRTVSPSESEIPAESSIASAEAAVTEILMSLLNSVAIEKSTSAEFIADQVLSLILTKALPFVDSDSQVYLDMKQSIEKFIQNLLQQVNDSVLTHISLKEILEEKESKEKIKQIREGMGRSILKRELSQGELGNQETKTKVKFQSITL